MRSRSQRDTSGGRAGEAEATVKERPEVPFRVVINEGVSLAKRFGATDGHKFVNAVLDRAARALRPNEH